MASPKVDVLYMDDSPICKDQLEAELNGESFRYRVDLIPEQKDVFDCLNNKQYDLILLGDLKGKFNRPETISKLAHNFPQMPMIVLSEDTKEKTIVDSVKNGAAHYVFKSNLSELESVIDEVLHNTDSYVKTPLLNEIAGSLPGLLYQFRRDANGELYFSYTNSPISDTTHNSSAPLGIDAGPIFGAIVEEDRARIFKSIEESGDNLTLWQDDFQVTSPKGETRWIRGISNPERQEDGVVVWNGLMIDVTRERQFKDSLEETIRESEERMRISNRFAKIHTWEWNIETNKMFWSHRLDHLPEYEYKGLNIDFEVFVDTMHPDDKDRVLEAIRLCIQDGAFYDIENRAIMPDGRVMWLHQRGNVIRDADGTAVKMLGVTHDITQQKEITQQMLRNEQQLQKAQGIAKMGHWVVTYPDETLEWSDSLYRLFGMKPGEYKPTVDLFRKSIHKKDYGKAHAFLDNESFSQHSEQSSDHRIFLPDGKVIWVHMEALAERNSAGEITRISGTLQDISARKKIETELMRAKEEAERANRAKSEFLSSMSHELRTPMNAIVGFSQLLELDGSLTTDQDEMVNEIGKASEHLLDLINDVLDLSKIESGKLTLSIEPVNFQEVLKECENLILPLAQKHEVDLIWPEETSNPTFIYVDRIRIKEVFLNLLSNATKYNRPGGQVTLTAESKPKKILRVSVTDTGSGIPKKLQDSVFKTFSRLGAEYSEVEGSGIGLVITKRLVEVMGGEIGFDSSPKGTTFWVEIPLASKQDIKATKKSGPERDTIPAMDPGVSLNILHVEDNPANLKLIQKILARRPFANLLSTHDGEIGLELAIRKLPDVILLDINLPGLNGFEILKKLKAIGDTKGIPVLALSANAQKEAKEAALQVGFKDYLTKPINVRYFLNLIDQLANEKNLELTAGKAKIKSIS